MTMRLLVLGAGMMGRAIAHDLSRREEPEAILVADRELARAEAVAERLADRRVTAHRVDVTAPRAVRELMTDCDAAISAVPYFLNLPLARAAVDTRTHFCDLGGSNRIVADELALDEEAQAAGVTVIPDCGLAPGLVNLLTAAAIEGFENVEAVRIRVGGLPQHPHPPLDYQLVFSAHGLLNEYMEDATILRDGRIATVPSLTGLESLAFPPPYERLEAFHTSGGSSTLPQTLEGRVRSLDYKTIRYPGHAARIATMAALGFFDTHPRPLDGGDITPRDLAVSLFTERLSFDEPDVVLLRVSAQGTVSGHPRTVVYEMIDTYDEESGLSAMMRTTGFPIAQIGLMLASGQIPSRGALPQERCVPTAPFLAGLEARGLAIHRSVIEE
jgi:lysine 6-dehydrogenase